MKCNHHCENHIICIDHVPIFASLNHEEKMEIIEIATSRIYKKGETVYMAGEEGNTLFVIYTGKVKLSRLNANGKEQVLRLVESGEFMGELSLFSSIPLTDNAQALEETTMCILQGDRLKELMAKHPSITFKVMDELSRRLEKAENRIEDISLNSVNKRVASALIELSNGKKEFLIPMTKGDLASQLGITQETLSRKLASLQEEGLIILEGHRKIIINNKEELESLSLYE
ncbi:MAG TPA: Crp/Fnr family transcriptional regulator [Clostridiales bacterium]|nr:Crp/Fnr family transcriptional regulator [Clostridiales bacterium]